MKRTTWLSIVPLAAALGAGLVHCVGEQPDFPDDADASSSAHDAETPKDDAAPVDAGPVDSSAHDATLEDAAPSTGEDAPSDAPITDASTAACDPQKSFGRLTNVSELNGPTDDESARLSPQQLTIYFSRRSGPAPSGGGFNVYVASRVSLDASFNGLTKLSLGIDPSGPSVTGDQSILYYSSGEGDSAPDIVASTPPFDALNARGLTNINTDAWEFSPYVRADNLELYFASNRVANTDDIYVSPRVNGEFAAPVPITSVNTDAGERAPVISSDNLTLYFASNRTGNYDIYAVHRKSEADSFGAPTPISELNTPAHESPDWISPDGCTLYFRSDRADGGKGGRDIWRATRPL